MTRTRFSLVMAAATALAVATTYVVRDDGGGPPPAGASEQAPVDEAELDRLIDLFTSRADERGESLDLRTAGGLLLQRAGLAASVPDYAASRERFAASLELVPDDPDGLLGLGRASLGVHRFGDALDAADALLEVEPDSPEGLALRGDAAFGSGAYEDAAVAFDRLAEATPDDPAVLVRLAQLELWRSGPEEARGLAADAVERAEALGFDAARLAFYESFAGHLAFQLGAYDDAVELLESATSHSPTDHGALGELARIRAATGEPEAAIELLERANELVPEPDHLVLEGDLHTLVGDTAAADADYERAIALATIDDDHERAWARPLASRLLDEGDLARAEQIAETELSVRKDAGAWDLVAWARYHGGDLRGARAASDEALAIGIPDATFLFHAGVISAELGERDRAVDELTAALDLSPRFDPLGSVEAEELLARLR